LSHLRYVFRPEEALGKSHNLLSINAFKAQGVNFEEDSLRGVLRPYVVASRVVWCRVVV